MNIFWEENDIIHACESTEMHKGITLIWTKCNRDVPANKSFYGNEKITCDECIKELELIEP